MKREHRIVRAWCEVETAARAAERTYWLEFAAPEIAAQAAPGQFVMVGFGGRGWGSPFLPRPNSVAAVRGERIGLLIRAYGEGSRRLTSLNPGDSALLLGPLGSHYQLGAARRILCVAGGVGLAPFLFLPRWAKKATGEVGIRLLYGERDAQAVFEPSKIREVCGLDAEIWTEDGSLGKRGRVTDGIELDGVDLVLACGPSPMLKLVQEQALGAGVPCQLAVEAHMACGVGTCIGCAIETVDPDTGEQGYDLVCVNGPVFSAERLRW